MNEGVDMQNQFLSRNFSVAPSPRPLRLVLCILLFFLVSNAEAQNIGISTPFTSASASYFESIGINWGFGIPGGGRGGGVMGLTPSGQLTPNLGFSWNGGNVIPPFGNYNPAAGAQLNLQGRHFNLGLSMAKGASRTLVSQAPSIVVQNGFGGSMFSGQVTPFVTGLIPVVGDQPFDNAVTRALQSGQLDLTYRPEEARIFDTPAAPPTVPSSAAQGAPSLASIKAERAAQAREKQLKLESHIAEAKQLIESGRKSLARNHLRQALELTDDAELKKVLQKEINALGLSSSSSKRR
jgi:hypothetical protein